MAGRLRTSRVQGEVLERKLEAYFRLGTAKTQWHATINLLTVRYFYLIGLATPGLLQNSAGKEHSGLSVEDLQDQELLLKTYRATLIASAQTAMQEPLRPLAG